MNFNDFLVILKQKKQTVFSVVFVFLILSAVLILAQPFKYGAETKLLVVQNTQTGTDPYQVNKANEYVADVLSDVVLTNSFFNEIVSAGFNINRNYFPEDPSKQLKEWKKTVKTNSSNRGIVDINVYHKDRDQADQIIRAINATLKNKHKEYHGSGDQVSIRVIDQPIVSDFPVKPNILLNIALGLVFGFLFAFSYIYLFPESRYDLRLWPGKKSTKKYIEDDIDDHVAELALPGVDTRVAYDVREAINKLRQREKQEGQAYAMEQKNPVIHNQKNIQNINNSGQAYDDISRQGSMDNVL